MKLFVDMDGVLADFDRHYEDVIGYRPCKVQDNADWEAVRKIKDFYLNIPPMPDLAALWARIAPYNPIVLTGIPKVDTVPEAADNKRAWARKHLGEDIEIYCIPAKEKFKYAAPGHILIDDWVKYKSRWVGAGGTWITHVSAVETDKALTELGL